MLKTEYHCIRFQRSHPWISIILILCFAHSFALPIENLDSKAPQLGHAHNSTSSDTSGTLARLRRSTESESVSQPSHAYISESSNSTDLSRFRRNPADKFANSISKLEALARISSGISLEIGLIDGSITSDDVVAKLLRMDTLSLDDVTSFDQTVINGVLDRPSQSPPQNDRVKMMENWLVSLDGIRKNYAFMTTFATFPGKEEYKNQLVEVNKIKDLATKLTKFEAAVKDLKFFLEKFVPPHLDDSQLTELLLYVNPLKASLEKMQETAKTFDSIRTDLKKVKELEKVENFYEILNRESRLRAEIVEEFIYDTASLKQTFDQVYKSRDDLKSSQSTFSTLELLMDTRTSSYQHSFGYSTGLSKGYSDLSRLYGDSGDAWITDHVPDNSIVTDNLRKVFSPFTELAKQIEHIETMSWKNLQNPSLSKVVRAIQQVSKLPSDSQKALSVLELIKDCENGRGKPTVKIEDVSASLKNIQDLNQQVKDLSLFEYADGLKDLSALIQLLPTDQNPKDQKTAAQEYLDRMKSSKKFVEVCGNLTMLQDDVGKLAIAATDIPVKITNLEKDIQNLNDYHHLVAKPSYLVLFTCLKDTVKDETEFIKGVVTAAQSARLDSNTLKTAKSEIAEIIGSSKDLNTATEKAETIKNNKNSEGIRLVEAFGSEHKETSKNLGTGVQGLGAIGSVNDAKANLKPLLENIDAILKDSLLLSSDHQNSLQKLKLLPDVFKSIDYFLDQIYGVSVFLRKLDVNFKDQGKIFEEASKIKDLIIDIAALRSAMEALKLAVPKKYDHLMTSLDTLETLDMNFSRFQIQNAIPSLTSLDVFFDKYVQALSTPRPTSPPIEDPPPVSDSSPRKKKIKERDHFEDFIEVSWVFILSVLIIVGGTTCILWCNGCCSCCLFLRKPDVNFKDQGKFFEEASKVNGLEIDIESVRSAMEALKSAVPKKYDQLMTSLDTLETLDMNFSRFQIQKAIPSLTSLDEFFEKYAKVLSTPKPTSPSIEDPPSVSDSSPRKRKIKERDHFGDFIEVSWVFILSVLIIVGEITCILWCNGCCSCCCKKKEDGLKDQKK